MTQTMKQFTAKLKKLRVGERAHLKLVMNGRRPTPKTVTEQLDEMRRHQTETLKADRPCFECQNLRFKLLGR